MKAELECPDCGCAIYLELELKTSEGDSGFRIYPAISGIKYRHSDPPSQEALAVLQNRNRRDGEHYKAGVEAKVSMGRIKKPA